MKINGKPAIMSVIAQLAMKNAIFKNIYSYIATILSSQMTEMSQHKDRHALREHTAPDPFWRVRYILDVRPAPLAPHQASHPPSVFYSIFPERKLFWT